MPKNSKRRNKSKKNSNGKSKGDRDVPPRMRADIQTVSVPLTRPPKNYTFVQTDSTLAAAPILGTAAGNVTAGIVFKLANLSNVTAFQSLFDQYRICAVDFVLRPRCNSFVATASSSPPPLYLVIDYDNSGSFSSVSQALEYSTCSIVEVYQSVRRAFQPRFALAAYQGAFTGYSSQTGWIDCAYPSVEHYGIRYWLPTCTASFTPEWDIDVKYHLEFRNVI